MDDINNLENIFTVDKKTLIKLQEFAYKLDYKKLFFGHLGPELTKLFIKKKDKVYYKHFLEACQYEYGFFDTKIDLLKAFSLYKKYADLNDYFCMYKMHVIYLCEYEKFNVPFSRVLEKTYLLKCFAYLPNYINFFNNKLFNIIDVTDEIKKILDLEDYTLEKHRLFFELLYKEREEFNLTTNDYNLIKGVFFSFFHDQSDSHLLAFFELNSLIPKNELDYAYYAAKNKCIYLKMKLQQYVFNSDLETEKFYEEIKNKKIYDFYSDYGDYLLFKTQKATPEIIEIFTTSSNKGFLRDNCRIYQCFVDHYEFGEIMADYNKASTILDLLLELIVFEKPFLGEFILLVGVLIKYCKFPEKIIEKYLIYVKEISDYINPKIIRIDKEKNITTEEDYLLSIKAYFYSFGFKDIEEQNLQKAVEYFVKGINTTKSVFFRRKTIFFKYNVKKLIFSRKMMSKDEFAKEKKDMIDFFYNNLNLKNRVVDCYIIGGDFLEGIIRKKDTFIALLLYQYGQYICCLNIIDCFIRSKIKKYLMYHEEKIENKFITEICYIRRFIS